MRRKGCGAGATEREGRRRSVEARDEGRDGARPKLWLSPRSIGRSSPSTLIYVMSDESMVEHFFFGESCSLLLEILWLVGLHSYLIYAQSSHSNWDCLIPLIEKRSVTCAKLRTREMII